MPYNAFNGFPSGACLHPPVILYAGSTCNNELFLAGDGNSNQNSVGINRQQESTFRQNVATAYLDNLVRPGLILNPTQTKTRPGTTSNSTPVTWRAQVQP